MMKKNLNRFIFALLGTLLCWTILTIWVQYAGDEKTFFEGNVSSSKTALIVYNPDPIYNLDEQISKSFAKGLAQEDFYVKISTIKAAQKDTKNYDCYIFCANTYNWAPDWLIESYITNHSHLKGKNVVAITLGSGSTKRAKRVLEKTIKEKNANLLKSESFWLMKPNNENRMEKKNTKVANEMAKSLGIEVGKMLP